MNGMLMNRGIWLAAALLVASGAKGAETTDGATATKPSAKSKKDGKKTEAKPGSSKAESKSSPSKSSSKVSKVSQADLAKAAAVGRAKSVYMYAIEACERPDRCDTTLRDGAESQFMEACLVCASQEKCDAEKAAVQNGSARNAVNPCLSP
jgi:hypothetical protein